MRWQFQGWWRHCLPAPIPSSLGSPAASSIHLAAADGRMHGHLLGSRLHAHRFVLLGWHPD
ncbi:hypothetical protein T02_9444 [Trichinella nativa]|uniref:Uncharacterized protein n=1 Tax=Trichinella nativa TaxID=6335 RepID=A0A0V1KP53_9BILA|nr:hypothetical protein T02_9444 [Trichinella nativa]